MSCLYRYIWILSGLSCMATLSSWTVVLTLEMTVDIVPAVTECDTGSSLHSSGGACVLCALQYQSSALHAHQREPESLPPGHSAHLHCPFSCQHWRGPTQLQLPPDVFHKQVCHHTVYAFFNTSHNISGAAVIYWHNSYIHKQCDAMSETWLLDRQRREGGYVLQFA